MLIANDPFGWLVFGAGPRRFEVSQKAVGTDSRGGTGSPTPREEEPAAGSSSPANRLCEAEARVEELSRVVAALARQGWVH